MIDRPSTWSTAAAWRTYAAAFLWIGGTALAFGAGGHTAQGWFRPRLDFGGVVLLAGALIGGWNFFPKAARSVRRFRLDMNFLMTVAILGALVIGEPVEAAAIAALFSLAELLEAAAVARARRSIEELVKLAPDRARRVTDDGNEEDIPAAELRAGERVRVRPGERIPVDGSIVDGESAVNEATVTGESVPATKGVGDPVYAGTLVAEGFLEIEATTDAGDTTLDRIVRLVRQAQGRRSPTEQFVDRFARYYTPAVTALAVAIMVVPPLAAWGSWIEWFTRGLTLLVIACPCALIIATPVTVVSAITSGARHGVLIKGGEHLETLGRTCAMAFDKTGTLTRGHLEVREVEGVGDTDATEVLQIALAAERRSEHPIARAIVAHAERQGVTDVGREVSDFMARTGHGVTARVDGMAVRVGTAELLDLDTPPARFLELQDAGRTVVLVAVQGRVAGMLALADQPRDGMSEVITELRALGVHELVMLTGDNERVARTIADAVGITDIRARLLPEQKVEAINGLRAKHTSVAMLGDGVNDAPALAAASVGIVMGAAGSPAAIETADVALMADDVRMLPYAVRLARQAARTIRFNIAVALGLKTVLAAGAITGTVSLLVAVLLGDLGASLIVTANATRLARLRPKAVR